jgi:hypothetical protein
MSKCNYIGIIKMLFNKSYKMVNLHCEKKKTFLNSYESLKEQFFFTK